MKSIKSLALMMLASILGSPMAFSATDVSAETQALLETTLKAVLPEGVAHSKPEPTPIPGIYKIAVAGGSFLFLTADGQYIISGELYQKAGEELVNLTENERKVQRKGLLADLNTKDMIVFPAVGNRKAIINVFTDVDCGYCRVLHKQVPELNKEGVEVRYMAFPREGLESMSYAKIATAWCDKNPQQALTDLKNGKELKLNVCDDNPVAKQYQLGIDMGVQGTPALVLMDGTMLPGYRPAADLLVLLGLAPATKAE